MRARGKPVFMKHLQYSINTCQSHAREVNDWDGYNVRRPCENGFIDLKSTSMSQPHWAQRINVVGTTGAGKTTVARRLSEILCISHVEIDALFWGPNWGRAPADILAQRVAEATSPGQMGRRRKLQRGT